MLIAKDITALVGLQEEVVRAEEQRLTDLQRVSEITSMAPDLFRLFLHESSGLLDQ